MVLDRGAQGLVVAGSLAHRVSQRARELDLPNVETHEEITSTTSNDGKSPVDFTDGRTVVALAAHRLHVPCGTSVITLPADRRHRCGPARPKLSAVRLRTGDAVLRHLK
ncbi:hypothetical protein [Streptomyces sp. NPDC048425]|uniref:hypothetical protein n=1 Tax=Streptomyces sp. NPDC048425 TaxID=3365548 RepID=UPI00372482BF